MPQKLEPLRFVYYAFKEIMDKVSSKSHKASWSYKVKQPQRVGMHEGSVGRGRARKVSLVAEPITIRWGFNIPSSCIKKNNAV